MADTFDTAGDTLSSPSRSAYAVTPSNSTALPRLPKALYIGTGGDVTLRCIDLHDRVSARIESNPRRKNLYPQLRDGFLL